MKAGQNKLDPDGAQWQGNRRRDGLIVAEGTEGHWVVVAGPATCSVCPCCGLFLQDARAARMVADMIYPVARAEA